MSLQSKHRWNSAAAHRALNYIKTHPEEWDQANWRCSSGMCFAGIVCALGGAKWVNPEPTNKMSDIMLWANQADDDYGLPVLHHMFPEPVIAASERARRLLGYTPHTQMGTDLFHSGNTIEHLESIIEILDSAQEARDAKAEEEARAIAAEATSQVV